MRPKGPRNDERVGWVERSETDRFFQGRGHPRLCKISRTDKAWMAGTSPAMTGCVGIIHGFEYEQQDAKICESVAGPGTTINSSNEKSPAGTPGFLSS
jgi:hypothetical protein